MSPELIAILVTDVTLVGSILAVVLRARLTNNTRHANPSNPGDMHSISECVHRIENQLTAQSSALVNIKEGIEHLKEARDA